MPDADRTAPRLITRGLAYMGLSAFFFSLMALLVKVLGTRLPVQEIILVRSVVSLLITYALLRRLRLSPWGNDRYRLFLRGFFGFLALSCAYFSLIRLPLADATVLMQTHPVFTTLYAAPMLNEAVAGGDMIALLLSLAGVLLMTRPSFLFGNPTSGLDPLAVGVGLLGAMLAGLAYVLVRRLRQTDHPLVVVFYFPLVSIPPALVAVVLDGVWPTRVEWLWLLGVGLAAQLGQVYLTRGLHLETAGRATMVTYLQFVFALIWGYLFFNELPGPWRFAGALLILSGLYVAARFKKEQAAPAA